MEHTPWMQSETHSTRVLALAKERGMIRPADLDVIGAPRVILTRLTAQGLLLKANRGLYHLPDYIAGETESLALVAAKVPQAVICLLSALQFHGLTTQLPRQVWIAMPRGSHLPQFAYPPLRMVQVTGQAYTAGIESHVCDKVTVRVYSVAKTIADCFKHRNAIGLDVALEALREGMAAGKTSADDLWRHAQVNRVANVMRPYMEALL